MFFTVGAYVKLGIIILLVVKTDYFLFFLILTYPIQQQVYYLLVLMNRNIFYLLNQGHFLRLLKEMILFVVFLIFPFYFLQKLEKGATIYAH